MPVGLMQDSKAYPASRLTSEARKPRTCITPSMLAVLQRCTARPSSHVSTPLANPITLHSHCVAPSQCV